MTATDELRRLLDERGVEYVAAENGHTQHTWWSDGDHEIGASNSGKRLAVYNLTPAQAIAATLGSGTCEADETDLIPFARADSGDFDVDYIHVMECSVCGGTYEHVNGNYEFCPRCGRKLVTA